MSEHHGIFRAQVKDIADPEALNRVRAIVPALLGQQLTEWAWPTASNGLAPALNSTVWVIFEGGDINHPVYFSQLPLAAPSTLPGGAGDLSSVIVLANALRAALVAAGLAK